MWLMEQKVIKKEFFRGKSHDMKCNVQQTSSNAKKAGIINESKFTSGWFKLKCFLLPSPKLTYY